MACIGRLRAGDEIRDIGQEDYTVCQLTSYMNKDYNSFELNHLKVDHVGSPLDDTTSLAKS